LLATWQAAEQRRAGLYAARNAGTMRGVRAVLPLLIIALAVALPGCEAPGPAGPSELGPPPGPILSSRTPEPVRPAQPPRALPRPDLTLPPGPLRTLPSVSIVIDAGHGGKDPGAPGLAGMSEKQVNLAVAREVTRLLRARGARVWNTRESDVFLTLDERCDHAEERRAALFVSIHADAARRRAARGTTVYIARNASKASVRAGTAIARALEQAGFESRGLRRAGYRVLVGHSRPAVLVECGFLSNPTEAQLLATKSYRDRVAQAIADGIVAFVLESR
jgi:N-acetylmuramoyl-L-alanine amidase